MGVKGELEKATKSLELWRATAYNADAVKQSANAKQAIDKASEVYKTKKKKSQEAIKKSIAVLNKLKAIVDDQADVIQAFALLEQATNAANLAEQANKQD